MENTFNESVRDQIGYIDEALAWVGRNHPEGYRTKFMELVNQRRRFKGLLRAGGENPALAAFGVSQVGKSYLMGCILKKDGQPFILKGRDREYNFLKEMNPQTVANTEATGVVTRFTSFARYPERFSEEYPILMRCLSLADIATILSDGYYNDIKDYKGWSESDLQVEADRLLEKYGSLPLQPTPRLTADDVLDMKEYHIRHLNKAQNLYNKVPFFENLAFVAERIPEQDLPGVLSTLWYGCDHLTRVLVKLMDILSRLGYAEYVYLPDQALLHNSDNFQTVMSVDCLKTLMDSPKFFTEVYRREGDSMVSAGKFAKSEIAALCREIIVMIGEDYLTNSSSYNLSTISDPAVRSRLKGTRPVRIDEKTGDEMVDIPMDILRTNDMLDFPGARGRKEYPMAALAKNEILMDVFLRGKVAYLFNVYNYSRLINVLFYCHHAAQHDVGALPHMLKDWIMSYCGETSEERRVTTERSGGISPFFYIATKFNMDMEVKDTGANSADDIRQRWQERFEKVLEKECFQVSAAYDREEAEIFNNWTAPGEKFGNSYLLRDFTFSRRLFSGEKTPDRKLLLEPDYYADLRSTFVGSEKVARFFPDPALSWDASATVDNDGATLIIDSLTTIAPRMDSNRTGQFHDILAKGARKVSEAIEGYVKTKNQEETIEKNAKIAMAVFREMAFTCNSDNYFFGHLIQALQLTEAAAYRILNKTINDPKLIGRPNEFQDYEIIVKDLENAGFVLKELDTADKQWNAIMVTYGFSDRETAEEYLQSKNVDPKKLFSGAFLRKKTSYVLADAVYDHWCERIKSPDLLNELTAGSGFDVAVMNNLTDELIAASRVLHLSDHMAEAIDEFVTTIDIHSVNPNFLADVLSSKINDFVLDFGFSMQPEDKVEKARKRCERYKLRAFRYIDRKTAEVGDLDQMSSLFDEMIENPQSLLPSFEDRYNSWIEYMFISFMVNIDVDDDFDKEANDAIKLILEGVRKVMKGPEENKE